MLDYESQLRAMLLRYPPRAEKLRIYIDPSISGCDVGWISGMGMEQYEEVQTPEEADFIPVWIDYKQRCSDKMWSVVEQFPDKCIHAINLINGISAELPDITDADLEGIQEMLASPDWESIYLGLNMLRAFYLDDAAKDCARVVIDSFQPDPMTNTGTIVPFGSDQKNAIQVGNIDIIRFFNIWLHNEFLTI